MCLVRNQLMKTEYIWINPLPDGKILALSKSKAFADDMFSVTQMLQFYSERVEKVMGKGDKFWLPALFSFPTMFSKGFFLMVIKKKKNPIFHKQKVKVYCM